MLPLSFQLMAQETVADTSEFVMRHEIHGKVVEAESQLPLPYTNIYVHNGNRGTVSNEHGHFSINIQGLHADDSIRFQFIGYKIQIISLGEMDSIGLVEMKEEVINLNEALIFGSTPNAKTIVKRVLENKDSNYRETTSRKQFFMRERDVTDIEKMIITFKKSTIDELDREMIKFIEDRIPRYNTSYTDFLGQLYFSGKADDSVKLKLDPIRVVRLKEEEIAGTDQIEAAFENVFADIDEKEYWKIRSGMFGSKLDDMNDSQDSTAVDSVKTDTIAQKGWKVESWVRGLNYRLKYAGLEDKDQWEFLYKTGKYAYTLSGGARVNGEDAYIIDFAPSGGGHFEGRMFVSLSTYALLRADYKYAPEKTGRDIHLLGVGYTENQFSGSIYFERNDDNYELKYFSKKEGATASVDRGIVLVKKRKRILFDKKLKELKVSIDMELHNEESIEFLILDQEEVSYNQFNSFEQKDRAEIIYVDQFDDKLWSGYSIIEPTQQMKEYKKQEVSYKLEPQ